jgi:hypothetical protein
MRAMPLACRIVPRFKLKPGGVTTISFFKGDRCLWIIGQK